MSDDHRSRQQILTRCSAKKATSFWSSPGHKAGAAPIQNAAHLKLLGAGRKAAVQDRPRQQVQLAALAIVPAIHVNPSASCCKAPSPHQVPSIGNTPHLQATARANSARHSCTAQRASLAAKRSSIAAPEAHGVRKQQVGGIALQQAGRLADQPVHHCLQRLRPLRFAETDKQSDG